MNKIKKFKINNYFYIDNVNCSYNDAIQIKKILTYLNSINLLKFSDLKSVDISSLKTVYLFLNRIKNTNDCFICMRCSVNNEILYLTYCESTEEKTLDLDITSNGVRKYKKIVGKENMVSLLDYHANIAELFLRKGDFKKLTYSVKNTNHLMKTSIYKLHDYLTNIGYIIKSQTIDNYEKFELYPAK